MEKSRLAFAYLFIFVVGVFLLAIYVQLMAYSPNKIKSLRTVIWTTPMNTAPMHLAVTVCGNRLEEAMVMIKSVTLLTRSPFHVYIFASDDLRISIESELSSWPLSFRNHMNFTLLPPQFPDETNGMNWKNLFRPCATQRLFLPSILSNLEALVYVDSDVLFLRPLDDIWRIFNDFNETQIAAVSPESESPEGNWYLQHPKTPRFPPYGVNTGVFLMNATRINQVEWLKNITSLYKTYKDVVVLGDQDLVNIYFSFFPERLYLMPCHWNYRSDHCSYKNNCESAKTGVSLIHGNRLVFHHNAQPIFRTIYQMFQDYRFDEDPEEFFNKRMLDILLNEKKTKCEQISEIFLRQLYINVVLASKTHKKST